MQNSFVSPQLSHSNPLMHGSSTSPISPPPHGTMKFPGAAGAPRRYELWQLLVAQLDVTHFEYSTTEIAALFGKCTHSITPYIREMFPRESGNRRVVHRLDFYQAVLLVRKICRDGKGLPNPKTLYQKLLAEGVITPNFPVDHPSCRAAEIYLAARRAAVLNSAAR